MADPDTHATLTRPERSANRRRLAAVLFSDIVGFTALTAEDEARAYQLVSALQSSAKRCVVRESGRLVRFVGDAVLAEFPSAEAAVRAALQLELEFEQLSAREGAAATLHAGIHLGDITEGDDGDIYGGSVNLAARLQTDAAPRQVLVSDDVYRALRGVPDFAFTPAGSRSLRGIADSVAVFAVRLQSGGGRGDRAPDAGGAPVATLARAELEPTRLIVLPFRLLRQDPEIEFLSFGLADAITATLSGLRSLVVRSSLAGQRYADGIPDLKSIGRETAVDLVLAGTLLRHADRVRVTAQLTDVTSGTVLWSESQQVQMRDLFQLQDDLTQRVVTSVATPLSARERRMIRHDVPATPRAYEMYLRANQAGGLSRQWAVARDLYRAALAEDPEYAPAWAQLGRCLRLLGKYGLTAEIVEHNMQEAEAAFRRALELNPDLPLAHSLYAQFEVEGGRPREGMIRLLQRAHTGTRDAAIFAGLVHALRYCGLFEESLAAHRLARRLDPGITTSVEYTYLLMGRFAEALDATSEASGDVRDSALAGLGRTDEAREWTEAQVDQHPDTAAKHFFPVVLRGLNANVRDEDVEEGIRVMSNFPDLEGRFVAARWLANFGRVDECAAMLRDVVAGLFCESTLRNDPWLASLREHAAFAELVERAAAGREHSLTSFLELNGPELLDARDLV